MDKPTQSFFKDVLLKRLKEYQLKVEEAAASLTDTDNNLNLPCLASI